jgi:hypothetical protein
MGMLNVLAQHFRVAHFHMDIKKIKQKIWWKGQRDFLKVRELNMQALEDELQKRQVVSHAIVNTNTVSVTYTKK